MTQLHLLITLCILLLLSCSTDHSIQVRIDNNSEKLMTSSVDDSTSTYQEYLGEKLDPIREYVARVDSISMNDWSLVMSKDIVLNDEKYVATFHVWNDEIKKIELIKQNTLSNEKTLYYLKNDELMYVSERSMEDLGEDGLQLLKNKSFFENGVLIRSMNNQDCGAPFNQQYRDEEQKRILGDLEIIRELYSFD